MRALRSKKDPSPFGDNIAALLKYLEDYREYTPGPEEIEEEVPFTQGDKKEGFRAPSYDIPWEVLDMLERPSDYRQGEGEVAPPSRKRLVPPIRNVANSPYRQG